MRGPVATGLSLQKERDSSWLDIDHLPHIDLGFKGSAAWDECQEVDTIENNSGSDGAKDGQAVEDRRGNGDGVANSGDEVFSNPETGGVGVDDYDAPQSKDDHSLGVYGSDAKGW